jgi:hypothetical protein
MKTPTKNVMREFLPNHVKFVAMPLHTLQVIITSDTPGELKHEAIQQHKHDLLKFGADLSLYSQFQDIVTDATEKGKYEKVDSDWDESCCQYLIMKLKEGS